MTISDISDEIYSEAGEPSDTSVAAIAYWTRNKLGYLNTRIYTSYSLNSSYEIVDEDGNSITIEATSILKKLWLIERYDYLIRTSLTSLDSSSVIEIRDDGSSVKKSDRNQTIKTLKELKKDELQELDFLIASYKIRGASPSGISGDDDVEGYR